jgi:ABC-type nitrate/sulfonate/bicarbonate transport system permease component
VANSAEPTLSLAEQAGAPGAPPRSEWIHSGSANVLLGGGTIVLALVLWEFAVRLFDVPQYVVPKPTTAIETLLSEWPLILRYTWITSIEILLGFVAGCSACSCIGTRSPKWHSIR